SYPDHNTIAVWARNIGKDRASRAWVWNRIAASNGRLTFGSDWPVVTLDPWEGIQTGVTRQTAEGKPAGGFVPSERLTLARAVEGYTMGAAYAGFRDRDEGSITVGKLGDVIMISQDIFKVAPATLAQTKVLLTVVAGKVVYRASQK
ncbi:MAG: amidohydrolase family protein, partial [Gemmatimonadaceae bacterium]